MMPIPYFKCLQFLDKTERVHKKTPAAAATAGEGKSVRTSWWNFRLTTGVWRVRSVDGGRPVAIRQQRRGVA